MQNRILQFFYRKRAVFLIFAICMLFLGMCCENAAADSFLTCQNARHTGSSLCGVRLTNLSDQVYFAVEKDSSFDGAILKQTKEKSGERFSRATSLPLGAALLLSFSLPAAAYGAANRKTVLPARKGSVIVCYIHQKDGKKGSPEK